MKLHHNSKFDEVFLIMKKNILLNLFFIFAITSAVFAQTKVSGVVVDKSNRPVPFANIAFKNSNEGVVSNYYPYAQPSLRWSNRRCLYSHRNP